MSIATKRGALNALDSLALVIRGQLPDKVTAYNAANGPEIRCYLAGPFAFGAVAKTLIVTPNNGAAQTVSLTGTMTAAQVVTALNAGFTAALRAEAILTNYVRIYSTVYGVAGNLAIGAGTANSILGLISGSIETWYPCRDLQWGGECYENMEAVLPSYPALALRLEEARPQANDTMYDYMIKARIRDVGPMSSMGANLARPLLAMAEMISDILRTQSNAGLLGQVNVTKISAYRPAQNIDVGDNMFSAYVDFDIGISVQEH